MTSGEWELYSIAWQLHNSGFSVIPSGGGESGKAPLVAWTEYQTRQPTDEEMHSWVDEYRPELWGIVTGDVVVFDTDTPEAAAPFEKAGLTPHVRTPRGGSHYYFKAPDHPVKTTAGLLHGLDVRGNGGFVNVCGHNHAGDYQILRMPTRDNIYHWEQLPPEVAAALTTKPTTPKDCVPRYTISEGRRNTTLARQAGVMRRNGMPREAIEAALLEVNRSQCQPPLPEHEVKAIAKSVSRYPPSNGNNVRVCIYERDNLDPRTNGTRTGQKTGLPLTESGGEPCPVMPMSDRVLAWVKDTTGWWDTPELDSDLGITAAKAKENRKKILQRFRVQGIIEPHPKINKRFRYVNKRVIALDFRAASGAGVLPIEWPLDIQRFVNLFPGNLTVVAGAPNAGKTALLLDFIRMNQERLPTYYWCSEMVDVELRDRLDQFPGMKAADWTFKAFERSSDFEDVIVSDVVNIIDYLEMTDELYRVNTHLTAISHKIGNGLAIVAIQKKEGAKFGRGQEFSLEKPKLYLSMDRGKLTIVKGKSWANPEVDPNGLSVRFKIIDGCRFEITRGWE